jgi:hypothetical protein
MILTAHQPVYLPWLGLFHKISIADVYVHYNHVLHSPHDYTARNQIKTPQGSHKLIVPLQKSRSTSIKLKDLEIDNQSSWRRKHWQMIKMNYSRTPFFTEYAPIFEKFYTREWKFIDELNLEMLQVFLDILSIKIDIKISQDLNLISGKNEGIIDMCKKLDCNKIVFGTLGRNYVDKDLFQQNDIKINFQSYIHPEYTQRFWKFKSHMSIIDLIFNHGPKSLDILREGNVQKEELCFN